MKRRLDIEGVPEDLFDPFDRDAFAPDGDDEDTSEQPTDFDRWARFMDEDPSDEPTDLRPVNGADALRSAVHHALGNSEDPSATLPSLVHMGVWLGFTEHEVLQAVDHAIDHDPEPSLDSAVLAQFAAEAISAVQLIEDASPWGAELAASGLPRLVSTRLMSGGAADVSVHVVRRPWEVLRRRRPGS